MLKPVTLKLDLFYDFFFEVCNFTCCLLKFHFNTARGVVKLIDNEYTPHTFDGDFQFRKIAS